MAADADFRIVDEAVQRLAKRLPLVGAQQRFADAHGMFPDAGVAVAHAGNGVSHPQLAKAFERAERVEPRLRVGASLEQLGQRQGRLWVAAMHEQALGGVALPAAWAVECGDQLRGVPGVQIGDGPWFIFVTVNPVNPAPVGAGTEVDH